MYRTYVCLCTRVKEGRGEGEYRGNARDYERSEQQLDRAINRARPRDNTRETNIADNTVVTSGRLITST